MKIAFLGDSITEGIPGVSFVDYVSKNNGSFDAVNLGKGGDTVASLLKRVRKMDDLDSFDVFVLFVGINDVYGKLTPTYKILKALKGQKAARNYLNFEKQYKELINYLIEYRKKIIVIPPLLLGEDFNTQWNYQVFELVSIVKSLTSEISNIVFVDARAKFVDELSTKDGSTYLPLSIRELYKDVTTLKSAELVDKKSSERGLHLTLDGVHINSKGATILSNMIIKELNKYDGEIQ